MFRKLISQSSLLKRGGSCHLLKRFCTASNPGTKTYEGDGKTSVNILNNDMENGLLINAISQIGFRLNNDLFVVGPMIIFPRSVLSWNVEHFEDISDQSMCIFHVLEPKIDLVVLGIGDQKPTAEFQRKVLQFMRKYKINIEMQPTEQACATFNFLNSEGRMVAGALIPPATLTVSDDEYARYMLERQNLLALDE